MGEVSRESAVVTMAAAVPAEGLTTAEALSETALDLNSLLAKAREGSEPAFAEIVSRFERLVRGTILRIISLLSSDKDAVMVADGEVAAFSPEYKELGGIRGGNKGYIGQNQPLFTEPLSPADVKQMQGLRNFTEMNKRDFNALVGGFAARPADVHAPKKTGPAGGKSSKKPGYDPETGPTGPGGGFIQTDSREFMDNQFRGHGDNQRQPLEQRPQEPPRREESHP